MNIIYSDIDSKNLAKTKNEIQQYIDSISRIALEQEEQRDKLYKLYPSASEIAPSLTILLFGLTTTVLTAIKVSNATIVFMVAAIAIGVPLATIIYPVIDLPVDWNRYIPKRNKAAVEEYDKKIFTLRRLKDNLKDLKKSIKLLDIEADFINVCGTDESLIKVKIDHNNRTITAKRKHSKKNENFEIEYGEYKVEIDRKDIFCILTKNDTLDFAAVRDYVMGQVKDTCEAAEALLTAQNMPLLEDHISNVKNDTNS